MILSSANALNLVKAKILSFGKDLTTYHKKTTFNAPKKKSPLKRLSEKEKMLVADDKLNVTEQFKFDFKSVENIVVKGENAGYQQRKPY